MSRELVSLYSLISAVSFFSVSVVVIILLRRRVGFLNKHGVSVLLLATALTILRLVLPLDLPFSVTIRSWDIMPSVRNFFDGHIWVTRILLTVWGIGIVVVLLWYVWAVIRARRLHQNYQVISSPRVEAIASSLEIDCPVVVSPDVEIPYVAGIFRHTIYMPSLPLPDREIRLILMHEYQHVRSHDGKIKLFWGLIAAVLWWNPIVYFFWGEIDMLLEFRCDAKVTEPMDIEGRMQYLDMLVHMMRRSVGAPKGPPLSLHESAALKTSNAIQQRFLVVMNNVDKKPKRVSLAVKCLLVALFFASYMIIWQPAIEAPTEDERGIQLQLSSSPNDEITDKVAGEIASTCIVKINEKYFLYVDGCQSRELSPDEVASDPYKNYIILEECIP